jgi:hypothetical protein
MPSPESIYDIREDEIKIKGKAWDDEEVQRLCMKSLWIAKKMVDYWEPDLKRGEELFKKYEGEIISDYQRSIYEDVEDKVVIEPPIMKSPIRSLLGHIIKSRKSGSVETEEGTLDTPVDSDAEIRLVRIVMKDMERKTKEHLKVRDAVHDTLVSCYPTCILWTKAKPTENNDLHYDKVRLPWNSCVFGPINFKQPDMSDITELVFFDKRTQADLELNYPDQKDNIRAHWKGNRADDKMLSSIMHWEGAENSTYRDYLSSILDEANAEMSGPAGMLSVYQRIFQIRRKEEVWINLFDDQDLERLPVDWDEERRQQWVNENQDKYAGPIEKETTTLWLTVFTSSGLVLANEAHWFQENGKIPADFFVAAIINGRPSGPAIDMDDDTLRNCVAQIEFLDDMRKGGGNTLVAMEGAFSNPEVITEEMNKTQGVLTIKKNFPGGIANAYKMEQRQASKQWGEYADYAKGSMYDNTRINEAMQGVSAPRQAAVAKVNEIAQALTVNALYIDNHNAQWENVQNLKLAMIAYAYSSYNIPVDGFDEEDMQEKGSVANVPQYGATGEVENVINDITSRKYRWKISPVDNSPTAKSSTMQDALMILNGAFGPLMQGDPSGELLADFLSALDNPILNKAGKKLAARAKEKQAQQADTEKQLAVMDAKTKQDKANAELERAKKQGVALNFNGADFSADPNLYNFYLGLRKMMADETAAATQPPPPAQPQSPQPAPGVPAPQESEMAMA